MKKFFAYLASAIVLSVFCGCAPVPSNPYENPANVKILVDQSLTNVKDTLLIGTTYPCSVSVYLPALVDTVIIRVDGAGKDGIIQKIAVKGISPIVFSFSPPDTGAFAMQVIIIKTNNTEDSLSQPKRFLVAAPQRCKILSFTPSVDSLVVMATPYLCTALVALPVLADSFAVRSMKGSKDSLLASGGRPTQVTPDTGAIVFPFSLTASGTYTIRVYAFKSRVVQDSLVKTIAGFTVPQINPVFPVYRVLFGDSASVRFHVTAPDSDLLGYSTFFTLGADTSNSQRVDVLYPFSARVGEDTIMRVLLRPLLRVGLAAPLVCYAQAVTRSYVYSSVAACSVYVADTMRPKITLLAPHVNPVDSIVKLPDSIIVKATDTWAVDSVTINGVKMLLKNDSLGQYLAVVSALNQGVTFDTIIAWDKAHNTDTVVMALKYGGPPAYPPKIKNLDRIVREGRVFDTLFLDTCITITDPDVVAGSAADSAYRKELTWIITDSSGTTIPYNATTRKFFVPVKADSEWVDTFNLNFKVIATGGLSDSRVETFMVYEVPDPPKITLDNLQVKFMGIPFDTLFLDTCASDPDNASSTLDWTFKNGKYFQVDSLMSFLLPITHVSQIIIRPRFFTRKIVITPDTTKINPTSWVGSDTLTFTVTDPTGLSQSKRMIFSKRKLIVHSEDGQPAWGRKND